MAPSALPPAPATRRDTWTRNATTVTLCALAALPVLLGLCVVALRP